MNIVTVALSTDDVCWLLSQMPAVAPHDLSWLRIVESLRNALACPSETVLLLRSIRAQLEKLTVISQDMKDLVAKIDSATNDVATRLNNYAALVKNSMTDQEVADIKAGMQAEIDRLTAMGKDPASPLP